jgi:hypothetical protein
MEIWDEYQWEDFLREADRRTDLYLRLLEAYVRDNPPPPEDAADDDHAEWQRALDDHLAERMGWSFGTQDDAPHELNDAGDEPDEGEDWKAGLPEQYPEEQDAEDLPLYQLAEAFGEAVLSWADTIPEAQKDVLLVEACANALQVAAKLAGGHGMGYELESLGGNIAYTKRALHAANRALAALHALGDAPFVTEADYRHLYEQGFELRNAVGLHVQTLREQFEKGIE